MNIDIKKWQRNKDIKLIFNLLKKKNEETRFIGGCLRNLLLNKDTDDIDIATSIEPRIVLGILKKRKIKTVITGISHGTIIAIINNKKIEVTTLRKDIKTDGRYAKVKFTKDWVVDSNRRDLTINALSCNFKGELFDYHNGLDDLKKGNIQFIGDTEKRIKEDYLRFLRYFRFYGLYGRKKINEDIQTKKDQIEKDIQKETLSATKEIEKFKINSLNKVNIISEEIISEIIQDIFKEDLNKSSIKATVSEVMKERKNQI